MSTPKTNSSLEEDCTSPVQTHALQLALKTMNERCQQLQQRLISVEEENLRLKGQKLGTDCSKRPLELQELKDKVEELTKQKNHLTQHINMVATENRNLWSRLSKMTKDNHSLNSQSSKLMDSIEPASIPKQHIIRSKTFTQSTPNAKLCPKISTDSDLSLEEISLKLINNFMQDKSVLEEQYEQMIEMHSDMENDAIGFSYINDNSSDDLVPLLNQCTDAYTKIKMHVLEQRTCLQDLLNTLKNKSIDKCERLEETQWATPTAHLFRPISDDNLNLHADCPEPNEDTYETMISRVCPMCSALFTNVTVNELAEHVEKHFNDDMAIDSNYEIVTHTVGNF